MYLVKQSQNTLNATDAITSHGDSTGSVTHTNKLVYWLPGIILLAVIAAILMFGSPNKPGTELDWLNQLANKGDAGAQLQLGLAYRDGRYGLAPDAKTALHWLQLSANSGNAFAEDALGTAYAKGQGTQANIQSAEQWWRKAIKDGDRSAKVHLANALFKSGQTQEADQLIM